jgi:Protein of unknown function (DUF2971)
VHDLDELLLREWLVPADVKTRVIYHYTTAAGLIGILTSGVLRGTNAAFLNDTSEIEHGRTVCLDVLKEERVSRSSDVATQLIERVIPVMRDEDPPSDVYVTSFSARRDLLSQWRGYGSDDGRFCIGFQLSRFSERDVLRLPRRVEYAPEQQQMQVRRAVEAVSQSVVEGKVDAVRGVTILALHLRRIMLAFKDPGFHEEQEWRSVATMMELDLRFVGFEAARGMPRPFVPMLSGSSTSAQLPVVEVCVGYSQRRRATLHATRLLLDRYGYGNASLTETAIPFSG